MTITASESVTSPDRGANAAEATAPQERLTATETPRPRDVAALRTPTLGTRLALSVALSVATVISLVAMAGAFVAGQQLEADLRETARVTAVALADEIELRTEPPTRETLLPILRNFMNAAVDLNAISVFTAEPDGPRLVVHTSELAPPPDSVVRQAIASNDEVWSTPERSIVTLAVPMTRDDSVVGAVAVSISLRGISQLQRRAGLVALRGRPGGDRRHHAVDPSAGASIDSRAFENHSPRHRTGPWRRPRCPGVRHAGQRDAGRRRRPERDARRAGRPASFAQPSAWPRRPTNCATATRQLVRSYESVSQLRETAARAQQLAAVGQTMANVAHQIGTPLNLVSGHVQLLQQETADPALRRRLRDRARNRSTGSRRPVNGLLERARPPGRAAAGVASTRCLTRIGDAMRGRLASGGVTLDLQRRGAARERGRRRSAAGARAAEPGDQRARRDARRRHADARRRPTPTAASGSRCATPDRASPDVLPRIFRAVGHDQVGRPGHRPGPEHHARRHHRASAARLAVAASRDTARRSPSSCRPPTRRRRCHDVTVAARRILIVDDDVETCRLIAELVAAPRT